MSAAACKLIICGNKLQAAITSLNQTMDDGAYSDRAMNLLADQVDAAADQLNANAIDLAGTGDDD